MSRIYDALENRDMDAKQAKTLERILPQVETTADDGCEMESEMNTLYQTITAALPDRQHHSVLFVGARQKEGTSTITRELARTVASRLGKRVLLIDCDGNCDEFAYQAVDPSVKLEDILENNTTVDKVVCPVNGSNLSILPFFMWADSPGVRTSYNENGHAFWNALNERFDLVIVDYPQEMLTNGPVMTSKVDGVIIVVEAEKTRWQVASSLKDKIVKNGGNVLGVVFNKRRHYIPQFIYDRL
ncbi:MAG: ATPase involved in chromosome partitioning-like protein [Deltaproteobacteria bacterium]|nr:ATPase involved in chromosome partitioning-like protein [Deltaproteobacteria bacterium]